MLGSPQAKADSGKIFQQLSTIFPRKLFSIPFLLRLPVTVNETYMRLKVSQNIWGALDLYQQIQRIL